MRSPEDIQARLALVPVDILRLAQTNVLIKNAIEIWARSDDLELVTDLLVGIICTQMIVMAEQQRTIKDLAEHGMPALVIQMGKPPNSPN